MADVSPHVRAAAIAALTAGEQPAEVAQRLGLDPAKVRVWKQRYVTAPVTPVTSATPATPGGEDGVPERPIVRPTVEARQRLIGELVLDLLRAKLEASRALAEVAHDKQWRAQQSASELATLGRWLDQSALALGDRLAGAAAGAGADADDADPPA